MNSKELRIGNMVTEPKFSNVMSLVEQLHSSHLVTSFSDSISYDAIKPISLTSEVFEMFQFEKATRHDQAGLGTIKRNVWRKLSFSVTIWDSGEFYYDWMGGNRKLEYVHELQNVYFALLQRELTL